MPTSLPPEGSTDWYAHYASIHGDVVDLLAVPPGETLGTGVVQLDSFSGANDDAKLTAAMSYAAAQTWRPAIQFPAGQTTFTTSGRTPYSGMKFIGPFGGRGPKNLEISGGAPVSHRVTLNVGSGTSAWFNGGSNDYYDVNFTDLAFHSGNAVSQFWHQPTGTLYACQFESLTFYGFKHIFGNTATKALVTQVIFSGHWTIQGIQDQQFHFGGSDNCFWVDNLININTPASGSGSGKFAMVFNGVSKSKFGYIYSTCEGGYGGILHSGSGYGNAMFGGINEGRNASSPATGPVMSITGGSHTFYGPWFGYVASGGGVNGAVHQSGGSIVMYGPQYKRASSVSATFPMLYQTGGTARIHDAICADSGDQIRVRWSNGTVEALPLIVNDAD